MNDTLGLILAGGEGSRLHPLTRNRAKPAVPFGGIYRIIDFTLSNAVNSGVTRIMLVTQYKSLSLQRHIRQAWGFSRGELGEYIEVVPPQMRTGERWYMGTADAVYQNLWSISQDTGKYCLVLSGDHVYKMDYRKLKAFHLEKGADVTVSTIEVSPEEAKRLGVLQADVEDQVIGFKEKPTDPMMMAEENGMCLANMGVYIFNRDALADLLAQDAKSDSTHDFGRDILPAAIQSHRVYAFRFRNEKTNKAEYWRDIGALDAYWEANMDLISVTPEFNLYDASWPLRTHIPQEPPAKFVFGEEGQRFGSALDSMVSHGCIVSGARVVNSILSPNVRVNSFAFVEQSIVMHGVNIGRHCKIRKAIIEKGTNIPAKTEIGYNLSADARRFRVTENGISVVEPTSFD